MVQQICVFKENIMKNQQNIPTVNKSINKKRLSSRKEGGKLLLLLMPCLLIIFVFHYLPLWGWSYAFFQYKPGKSIFSSEFVGFKNFTVLFSNPVMFQRLLEVLRNTGL